MTQTVRGTWPAPGTPVDPAELEAVLDEFDDYYPAPPVTPVERGGSAPPR